MPVNVVKTFRDEKAWKDAKAKLGNRYGDSDRHWATVMKIFKNVRAKMRRQHGK